MFELYEQKMLLALGIFDGKDPRFLEAPKKWLGESLNEGKQVGILYHYTSLKAALKILEQNELKPYKDVFGSGLEHMNYVSMTRDNHFHRLGRTIQGIQCRFIIDGDKLSHNYKITPFNDFEQGSAYGNSYGHRPYNDEQEERVNGSIKDIKKYIIKIQIIKDETFNKEKLEHYIDELGKFCPIEIIENKLIKEDVGAAAGTANAGGNQGGIISALAGIPSTTINDIAQFTPRIDMSVGKRRISRRLTYRRKKRKVKLTEGKQVGILYHYTSFDKIFNILQQNRLGMQKGGYVSFTRNKYFEKHPRYEVSVECRFVIDGDKLSNRYKIEPHNYYNSTKYSNYGSWDEQEERIIGSVENFRNYIIKIQLYKEDVYEYFSNGPVIFSNGPSEIEIDSPEELIKKIKQYCPVELI